MKGPHPTSILIAALELYLDLPGAAGGVDRKSSIDAFRNGIVPRIEASAHEFGISKEQAKADIEALAAAFESGMDAVDLLPEDGRPEKLALVGLILSFCEGVKSRSSMLVDPPVEWPTEFEMPDNV